MKGKTKKKIRDLKDLQDIRDKSIAENALSSGGYRSCVTVHMGTCGIASGARDILKALKEEIDSKKIKDVRLATSGCIGACYLEPVITVEVLGTDPVQYGYLEAENALEVFRKHAVGGKVVSQFVVNLGKGLDSAQEGRK
jgi:NADP-reducing hydrogenase subunit HndB